MDVHVATSEYYHSDYELISFNLSCTQLFCVLYVIED